MKFKIFDEEIGIYVKGNHDYIGDNNYYQDWERPIHIEFYEPDGNLGFEIDAGVKISGLIIRTYPQKSLAIFARDKYGSGKINYQIFPDLPITEFKTINLRNGGNELIGSHFTDALCQRIVKDTGFVPLR